MDKAQLEQALQAHRLWLETGGVQGKRANLSRANLSGANLSGANLSRANLTRANLTGAHLSGASLSGANLTRADLSWTHLTEADLTDANLSEADLTGAQFELEIIDCYKFFGAQVSEGQLAWLCLHPQFGEWRDSLKIVG